MIEYVRQILIGQFEASLSMLNFTLSICIFRPARRHSRFASFIIEAAMNAIRFLAWV